MNSYQCITYIVQDLATNSLQVNLLSELEQARIKTAATVSVYCTLYTVQAVYVYQSCTHVLRSTVANMYSMAVAFKNFVKLNAFSDISIQLSQV